MRPAEITAARELASTARELTPAEVRDLQSLADCLLAERGRLRDALATLLGETETLAKSHPFGAPMSTAHAHEAARAALAES